MRPLSTFYDIQLSNSREGSYKKNPALFKKYVRNQFFATILLI